jgi:serine phosphatase RsbU (regulator of sigma subunit)
LAASGLDATVASGIFDILWGVVRRSLLVQRQIYYFKDSMDESLYRHLPLFASLPAAELRRLTALMQLRALPADSVLFHEGENADAFFILLEGELEIVKSLGTPDEVLFEVVRPGEVFGEMSLFSRDRRRTASARIRKPVQMLEMTHADLKDLLTRFPGLALHVIRTLSVRLEKSQNLTIQDLKKKNAQLTQAYDALKAAHAQIVEKEKLEQELHIARDVQARLIPQSTPILSGWNFDAYWSPAREVSGDFYDFIPLPDQRLGLVLGDAAGKGMPAALAMATTCTMLRAVADQLVSPGATLARMNTLLYRDTTPSMFVTCLYGVLDPMSGRLLLANAGQSMPCVLSAAGVHEVSVRGMPLGLMEGSVYEEREIVLANRERVLMYSDGLVEAHSPAGQMLGFARLQNLVAGASTEESLINFLRQQLQAHVGPEWGQEDDVTIVTLERANRS